MIKMLKNENWSLAIFQTIFALANQNKKISNAGSFCDMHLGYVSLRHLQSFDVNYVNT